MDLVSLDRLKELLSYDPSTGEWVWIKPSKRGMKPGAVAGTKTHKSGYGQVCVDGKLYLTHRLAWFYMTGTWPEHEVDHKDGVPGHDQWDNLRKATVLQNRHNVKGHKDSSTGVKGVSWVAKRGVYLARICHEGAKLFLGTFGSLQEASAARKEAELRYFGKFASLHRVGDCIPAHHSPVSQP